MVYCYQRKSKPSLFTVQFIFQHRRAPEHNNPPGPQGEIFTGSWISSPPWILVFHTKFPKSADQDVLAGLKGLFDCFQDGFQHVKRLRFGTPAMIGDVFDDVSFGDGHSGEPPWQMFMK